MSFSIPKEHSPDGTRDTIKFDPSDPRELIRLNGALTEDALRARGVLFLPLSGHDTIEVDLSSPYRHRDALIEEYWRFHPRYRFLKTVARRARVVDIGAGDGGLIHWKMWGSPPRPDIFMYAIDAIQGEFFFEYVDYDVVDLNIDQSKYPADTFDAMVCSHLIDFVSDRQRLALEIARIGRSGAKIYVEWPNTQASNTVGRRALEACGISAGTVHFADDARQLPPLPDQEIRSLFDFAGCRAVDGGIVSNDFLFPELLRFGIMERDSDLTTFALWLAFGSVRYVIFEKR